MAVHKTSFSNREIIIQAPVKHPWPVYLNSAKSFLPRIIKGMSGICFWPLPQRRYCKMEKPRALKKKNLTVNTTKS